ncbi:MAG: adenylosuccinate lyase [Flavobacteriales bacterium]|nr:adenylosuccinate lyase [Flavobacteriales bacterium]
MSLSPLNAISPIDGRYHDKTLALADRVSEQALITYRIRVEVAYFRALCAMPLPELKDIPKDKLEGWSKRCGSLNTADAERVKAIERTTNHDVKAVEYFLKEQLEAHGLSAYKEFIHFGLTSQDVNNTALPLMLKELLFEDLLPALIGLRDQLHGLALDWARVPMLALTHGQPASPTRLGKEIQVFVERMDRQLKLLREVPMSAKFGGATGNFNAHHAAYPEVDWVAFANGLIKSLGLDRQQFTTQIEHYDDMAALFDGMRRVNVILMDLCRDLWQYISMERFGQRTKAGEVGSSAMPHKVNPIDLENAEGNLGVANALFTHLSTKLPISRMQRDLTDSTVTRNIGVPIAHTLLAVDAIAKGLGKLVLREDTLQRELEANWAVVAEGIQTILRRAGYPEPYERLKDLTRGKATLGREDIAAFIETLEVEEAVKTRLHALSPHNYTGLDLLGRVMP